MDAGSADVGFSGPDPSPLSSIPLDAPTSLFTNITITDNQVSDDQLFVG